MFARRDPDAAIALLSPPLVRGTVVERQEAFAALGELKRSEADSLLARWLDRLLKGEVPVEAELDLVEAAAKRKAVAVRSRLKRYEELRKKGDGLAPHRAALAGGDAENGKRIFFTRAEVSCLRCHQSVGHPAGSGEVRTATRQRME